MRAIAWNFVSQLKNNVQRKQRKGKRDRKSANKTSDNQKKETNEQTKKRKKWNAEWNYEGTLLYRIKCFLNDFRLFFAFVHFLSRFSSAVENHLQHKTKNYFSAASTKSTKNVRKICDNNEHANEQTNTSSLLLQFLSCTRDVDIIRLMELKAKQTENLSTFNCPTERPTNDTINSHICFLFFVQKNSYCVDDLVLSNSIQMTENRPHESNKWLNERFTDR